MQNARVYMVCLLAAATCVGCGGENADPAGGSGGAAGTGGTAGTGGAAGTGGTAGMGGAGGTGGALSCVDNDGCVPASYCDADDCVSPGACVSRPTVCPLVFQPVCGCDGLNYDNPCEAAAAGVRVSAEGPCPCTNNTECAPNAFCASELSCDAPGICELRPTLCSLVFDPVCGCDGTTYDNSCLAALNGARVAADGACP